MTAPIPACGAMRARVAPSRDDVFEAFARGDHHVACRLGLSVLGRSMKDVPVVGMVGVSAAKIGRTALADRYLRRALRAEPMNVTWIVGLAECLFQEGRWDDALAQYERALAIRPGLRPATIGRAVVLERRGDSEAALELIEPLIADPAEDGFGVAVWASIVQARGDHERTVEPLTVCLRRDDLDPRTRMMLARRAGAALEHLGRYEEAFRAIEMSNHAVARPHDPDAYERRITDLIETFSASNLGQLQTASQSGERPVFIATMPRSGSTLCEQVIHAHPDGHGAGEITDLADLVRSLPQRLESLQPYPDCLGDWTQAAADACAAWYVERCADYSRSARRVVNKHLDNDLHLGMVGLLFPGAKVIHCTRDPMDTCFSTFMATMNTEVYPWSTDLAHIAHAYRQHDRLMTHWAEVLDVDMLRVPYEAMIAEPDAWIRRIISFLGLPWNERCLAFHEARRDVMTLSYDQVRRPIYQFAVRRYERYGALLDPLRRALEQR